MAHIYVNNVLAKPKAIHIYDELSKQWKSKRIGYVYSNGQWIPFIKYQLDIYSYGIEYTPIVAGYSLEPTGSAKKIKNSDHLYLYAKSRWAYGDWDIVSFVTDNQIDVSEYSKMYISWSIYNSHLSAGYFGLVKGKKDEKLAVLRGESATSGVQTHSLDISSIQGNYYPAVFAEGREPSGRDTYAEIRVYKIWLE